MPEILLFGLFAATVVAVVAGIVDRLLDVDDLSTVDVDGWRAERR